MGKVAAKQGKPTQREVLALARAYLVRCADLLAVLRASSGQADLLGAMRRGAIPKQGEIEGVPYRFHGIGVRFETSEGLLDCEIGPDGSPAGFDAWRLALFADESLGGSIEERRRAIEATLLALERAGKVRKASATDLYLAA